MRLQNPFAAISATGIDSQVLLVLGRVEAYLTAAEVQSLLPEGGSTEGVRRSLRRFVDQGTVLERVTGRSAAYALNHEHLLVEPILQIVNAKETLLKKIAACVATWDPQPITLKLFGSAARGDMSEKSDIDLFIVFPDEVNSSRVDELVGELANRVRGWTGNDTRPLLYLADEVVPASIFDSILNEGIDIAGDSAWLRRTLRAKEREHVAT